jgi:hypothetical protein
LQILELPEGTGDDRPPFILVVDECVPQRIVLGAGESFGDQWQNLADRIGARGAIVTPETVQIPTDQPSADDDPERAGTTQLVYAHERSRLALCDALLLSRDTTWHQLTEQVAERQRTVARLFRQLDRVRELPDCPDLMDSRQEHPAVWKHGYQCGVLAAKTAARNERATATEGGA